jgi:glycosyltransferase involved in cell wall biosynthesis
MLRDPLSVDSILPWEKDLKIEPAEDGLPGVSIVIPIYNSGHFLEKTLRSLICNDLSGVELILMDGGSNDNTHEIIDHYRDIFKIAVSERDRGQSDAINKGYKHASQHILYWLNGDDIILPNALLAVRRAYRDNPGTEVVVGNAYMTEVDFTPIRHFVFSPEKLTFDHLLDYASNHLVQPSVFFSRKAWDEAGPVIEDLHYAMDADLFLNMASKFTFLYIPHDIGYSVYHEACKTRGKRGESITELALVQAKYGGQDQARKTLNILVSMFNDAEARASAIAQAVPPSYDTGDYGLLMRRMLAMEAEINASRQLLLAEDMKTSV